MKLLKQKPKKIHKRSPPAQPTSSPLPNTSSSDRSKTPEQKGAGFSSSSGSPPAAQKPVWYRFRTAITTVLVLNVAVIGYTLFRTRSDPKIAQEVKSLKEDAVQHGGDGEPREAEKDKESAVVTSVSHEPPLLTPTIRSEVQNGELREAEKGKDLAVATSISHEPSLLTQTISSDVQNHSERTTETDNESAVATSLSHEPSLLTQTISSDVQNLSELTTEKDKESAVATCISHEPSLLTQTIRSQVQNHSELTTEQQQKLFKWMLEEKRKVKPVNDIERAQIDQEKALLKQYIRGKTKISGLRKVAE